MSVTLALNYYDLLHIPATATAEQITQAWADRQQQQIRSEFTAGVSQARRVLLEDAQATLLAPDQRSAYDTALILDPPVLDLTGEALIAGLLFLVEAGETARVLAYGPLVEDQPDGGLLLALAHRETASEFITQGQILNGVEQLEQALPFVIGQRRYANLEKELKDKIRLVRPRWIIELLLRDQGGDRSTALTQFAEMLEERRGIEGDGKDGSGFNREQLFQYIQELLPLLDAHEQQAIFAQEALRPSVGASYLVSQVLIAQGLALGQPDLVRQARGYLTRLAQRRDVALELAVCALLLGQVEQAEEALARSSDGGAIASIRRLSSDSPDLLPGLCQYAQDWITRQLFTQTRDLKDKPCTLHAYFALPQVQESLEGPDVPEVISPVSEIAPVTPAPRPAPNLQLWLILPVAFVAGVAIYALWIRPAPIAVPAPAPAPIAVPTPTAPVVVKLTPTVLNAQSAEALISQWQKAKQLALGKTHDTTALKTILAPAQQTPWLARAQALAVAQSYWVYDSKPISILNVENQGTRGTITARIQENAQLYEGTRLNRRRSYQKQYTVRYLVERKGDGWMIRDIVL